jgi:hypothetical protein
MRGADVRRVWETRPTRPCRRVRFPNGPHHAVFIFNEASLGPMKFKLKPDSKFKMLVRKGL